MANAHSKEKEDISNVYADEYIIPENSYTYWIKGMAQHAQYRVMLAKSGNRFAPMHGVGRTDMFLRSCFEKMSHLFSNVTQPCSQMSLLFTNLPSSFIFMTYPVVLIKISFALFSFGPGYLRLLRYVCVHIYISNDHDFIAHCLSSEPSS